MRVAPEWVPVRPADQIERLLGRLLLEPQARVLTQELEAALWEEAERDRRVDLSNSLQAAVRLARGLLGDVRPFRVLVRDGDGYRLLVGDKLRIDAERFKQLAARGRELVAARPRMARAMLAEAVETWHGGLLAAHAQRDWVRGHAHELESIRDGAEVDLNEVRLVSGETVALEPELRRQLAGNPLDERRHSQLVRALHGDGRTAEAMNAYRDAARILGPPGPALRRVGEVVARGSSAEARRVRSAARAGGRDSVLLGAVLGAHGRSPSDPGVGTLVLVVDRHGGDVPVIVGDRILATFDDADTALAAARAIGSLGRLRARVGVHAGNALFASGAADGPGPGRCWELVEAAHPGHALASGVLRARATQVQGMRGLGTHRFADLSEPDTIYELTRDRGDEAHPPLQTLDRVPNNLPVQQTPFVGRRAEISSLARAVGPGKVISLVGLGGCGKTRLALQLAARQAARFPHGAWLVELAELSSGASTEAVALVVAGKLGARPLPEETLVGAVVRHLADRSALLLVDNCEHVRRACGELVAAVRARCPDVCVVATSRSPLGIAAETVWRVPPMATVGGEESELSDAVMLLLERSGVLYGNAGISDAALDLGDQICRAFEGLPLAIELAARQVGMRGLAWVAADVDAMLSGTGSLGSLESHERRQPDRQQTLDAAIDWSYRLLTADERLVLRRLAVFRGSFGVAEAGRLVGDCAATKDVGVILASLTEQSMIATVEPLGEATRVRLVEPIRWFALDRLRSAGALEADRAAHAALYGELAARVAPDLFGPGEQAQVDRLEADHDNLRAALGWFVAEHSRSEDALRLVGSLWWFWFSRGHLDEGCSWVSQALALDDRPTLARVRALRAGSHLTWWRGDYARTESYNAALKGCATAIGDDWGLAWAPMAFGAVELFVAPDRALALFEDSKRRFEQLGRRWEAGYALQLIGGARWFTRDEPAAREAFDQAVAIFDEIGHRSVLASVRRCAGLMAARCGNPARGVELCRAALRLSDEIGDRAGSAQALNFLAAVSRDAGDLPAAVARYAEALSLARVVGELWATCWALDGLAGGARVAGQPEAAASVLAYSGMLAARAGYRQPPREQQLRDQDIAALRAELDVHEFEGATAAGELMSMSEAVACALAFAREYV